MKMQVELTAPAGSFDCLQAAIQGGADSVYFGVQQLNMRAQSSANFTLRDLKKIVTICHKKQKKAYLALNTIIYDKELPLMRKIIDAAKKNKIDAVIVSDQAAMMYAYQKKVPVHLSTQLNISNLESVKFYSRYADVIVLARELSLLQIKKISDGIKKYKIKGPSGKLVKLEIFIHGALCVSISGKCYLSLHETGRSANRGECMQYCRRKYIVQEKESGMELEIDNEYILSPKDLCTIGFLDKIIKSGVSVLKIEGRARSPEYVKTVTAVYREAIEAICKNKYTLVAINDWEKRLSTVFNRGFWDGYYLGRKLGEWNDVYGSKATRKKKYVGRITNYYSRIKVAEMIVEADVVSEQDELLIMGSKTGVVEVLVTELRDDNGVIKQANKGILCAFPVLQPVRRSDKVYKWEKIIR